MSAIKTLSGLKRWQKWGAAFIIAVALYAVLGFFLAPRIAQTQAKAFFLESFDREVQIGEIKINPFALSLTILNFSLPDEDESPLVAFEEFTANFEVSSLFRRAFTFSEIRLIAPYLHAKIKSDGELNLAALVPEAAEDETDSDSASSNESVTPSESEASGPPALLVQVAIIERGKIRFSDFARPTPFEHEIAPIDLALKDFGTRPDDDAPYSFNATTGAGEAISWEGNLSVVPLYSAGRLALTGIRPRTGWLYIQDDVRFEVIEGTLDIEGQYSFDGQEELVFELSDGAIRLRDLTVADRESSQLALSLPVFDINGISMRYPEQKARIESLKTSGARYNAVRLREGNFRGQRMALPRRPASPQALAPAELSQGNVSPASVDPEPDPPISPPWTFNVDLIEVNNYSVSFQDRTTPTLFELDIAPIDLRIEDVSSDFTQPIPVALALGVGEKGRVEIRGPVQIEPGHIDLEVSISEIDLTALAPYWEEPIALELASGKAGLQGRLQARAQPEDQAQLEFEGDFRIDDFRTLDGILADELVSFSALELEGLSLRYEPTSFHLDRLGLDEPQAHVMLNAEGVANVSTVLRSPPDADTPETPQAVDEVQKESGSALVSNEPATSNEEAISIPASIDLIEITRGRAEFEDRTVSPHFSTNISEFTGRIEGLTSAADSAGQVSLSGRLGGATQVQIDGSMNALSDQTTLDLKVDFENFELSPFTPYSGRYVGKAIERGKLFVDLSYTLDGNVLVGENKLFLDQFTLGTDIESEEATRLPVGLAVALLKDRKGEIRIDLPVSGEIDDPEFSVGGIIFSALLNLVAKVAMSPFSIIGGLAASNGDELRYVDFEPGRSFLSAPQSEKLDTLAGALIERPVLSLEIKGNADPALDVAALQSVEFENDLIQTRFRELQGKWFGSKPASADEVTLEPKERSRLIEEAFASEFGELALDQLTQSSSPNSENEDPEVQKAALEAEMTKRLREQISIPTEVLRDLARSRASQVQNHLIRVAGIPAERIFVLDIEVQEDAQAERPQTTLSLAAY